MSAFYQLRRLVLGAQKKIACAARIKAIPVIDVITFITVQLRSVCGTVMPKYSFTIQNPASFTCERQVPPAQSARTIISGVYTGIYFTSGAMIPAAVMMATVAEPCAARIAAETM